MPEPVRGNLQLTNIIAGDKLRPGDLISARVRDVLPDGRYRLVWNGRILTAKSHLTLQTGQFLRARVEGKPGGLLLHLLNTNSKTSETPMPQASIKTLLSAALLRAGLSLPEDVETVRRAALLNRTKGRRVRMARLYAELLSKGADPTADFLESVEAALSGNGKYRNGEGRNKGRGNWQSPPGPEELADELAAESPDPEPLINLLNKIPAEGDRWFFRHLMRKLNEEDIQLTWKIRKGLNPALALTLKDGARTFEFLLEGLDKTRLSVFADEEVEIDQKQWDSFRKNLTLMNIEVDDTILSIGESDGFTPGTAEVVQDLEGRG